MSLRVERCLLNAVCEAEKTGLLYYSKRITQASFLLLCGHLNPFLFFIHTQIKPFSELILVVFFLTIHRSGNDISGLKFVYACFKSLLFTEKRRSCSES